MSVGRVEFPLDLLFPHLFECLHRIGIFGGLAIRLVFGFPLLFCSDSLGSFRRGNGFLGFGVIVAEAVLAIKSGFTVVFVTPFLSAPRTFASFTTASAAFPAFGTVVPFAFAFAFAFTLGQLRDGRLLSCDSGFEFFDGTESILIRFRLP